MPRVLIVDDDEPFRRQLARILQAEGAKCTHVGTDEEARRLAQDQRFDFIYLDLAMDAGVVDLERSAFCAEMSKLGARLIGMTGLRLDAEQAFDLGKLWLDDFVQKGAPNEHRSYVDKLHNRRAAPRRHVRFRAALSYAEAGEPAFVAQVADLLVHEFGRRQVFYAPIHQPELSRPDADSFLEQLYAGEAGLVVVFLSASYGRSGWCAREWRAMQQARTKRAGPDVMLIRLDRADFSGFFPSIDIALDASAHEDGTRIEPIKVARAIIERIDANDLP